jgi:hypothetical protein
MLLSFTGLTKVLVTTGYGEGSKKLEIIDLEDPTNVCQLSFLDDEYPFDGVSGASGGLLTNNTALICGGTATGTSDILDACFTITFNIIKVTANLYQPRSKAASCSVVLNSTTLWVTGGWLEGTGLTESTEFVQLTGTTPGPNLPLRVWNHCLVSLNDTTTLLIDSTESTNGTCWYYNSDHEIWTEGPSLISGGRYSPSCALFKSPHHGHTDTVIFTGGYNGGNLVSTEFLKLDSGNSWTLGKGQLCFKIFYY